MTETDFMFHYLLQNEIDQAEMDELYSTLQTEEYDSDSLSEAIDMQIFISATCSSLMSKFYSKLHGTINAYKETFMNEHQEFLCICMTTMLVSEECKKLILQYFKDVQLKTTSFDPGILFWYWQHYSERTFKEDPKYENITGLYMSSGIYIEKSTYTNLKEEFIEHYKGTTNDWNDLILSKSEKLAATDRAKQIVSADRNQELHYDIQKGVTISIQHLQSIIMWSDFTELAMLLRLSFTATHFGEPISSIINRHCLFYHFAKTLRETVQYFGHNRYTEKGPFYFGLDKVVAMSSFSLVVNSPLSTSKNIQIAINFAGNRGMVVKLENDGDYESRNHVRFFDCSWISDYKKENERLFFEPQYSVRIVSIKIMKTADNFEKFINSLYLLDCMIRGINMEGAEIKMTMKDKLILHKLIRHELGTKKWNENAFVSDMFHSFCISKTEICININILDWYFTGFINMQQIELHEIILYTIKEDDNKNEVVHPNLLRSDIIKLFPNLKQITIITTSSNGSDSYSISINELISIIDASWNPLLTKIKLKASYDKDNVHGYVDKHINSWLSKLWEFNCLLLKDKCGTNGWEISLVKMLDEDWLILNKKPHYTLQQPALSIKNCFCQSNSVYIDNCDFIKSILHCLKDFSTLNKPSDFEIETLQVKYPNVLDDFVHLVKYHGDHFEEIYKEIITGYIFSICDVVNCESAARYNKQIGKQQNDTLRIQWYNQLIDSLHCYVFHSFDMKSETLEFEKEMKYDSALSIKDTTIFNNNLDKYVIKNCEFVPDSSKQQMLLERACQYIEKHTTELNHDAENLRIYLQQQEYDTDAVTHDIMTYCECGNIQQIIDNNSLQWLRAMTVSPLVFNTGIVLYYWPYYEQLKNVTDQISNIGLSYSPSELYAFQRHDNFKNEISNYSFVVNANEVYHMNELTFKATKYLQTEASRKMVAICPPNLHYGVKTGDLFTKPHMMSVLLYCNYSKLCTKFSSTFRHDTTMQSLSELKDRNSRFWWMSKLLRETVELFGNDRYREQGPFYCGVDKVLALYQFNIRLCGPTSTTKQRQVAERFASEDGMLIHLNNNGELHSSKRVRWFDCSWISHYKGEAERLFFGGGYKIRIQSLSIIRNKRNFEPYYHALYLFDCMVSGANMQGAKIKINPTDYRILSSLISGQLGKGINHKIHSYIVSTFSVFCFKKSQIIFDMNQLDWYFRKSNLCHLLFNNIVEDGHCNNNNILKANVFDLFQNAKKIIIFTTDKRGITTYSFALKSLLAVINSSLTWKLIAIKAMHDADDVHKRNEQRSWLYESWNQFMKKHNDESNLYNYQMQLWSTNNEDYLAIERSTKLNFSQTEIKYATSLMNYMVNGSNMYGLSLNITTAHQTILSLFVERQLNMTKNTIMSQIQLSPDLYIYNNFNEWCKSTYNIVLCVDQLQQYFHTISHLIMQSVNMPKPELFQLFPNSNIIQIDTKDELSMDHLLLLIDSVNYSNLLVLTANGLKRSWISHLWDESSLQLQKQFIEKQRQLLYKNVLVSQSPVHILDQFEISKVNKETVIKIEAELKTETEWRRFVEEAQKERKLKDEEEKKQKSIFAKLENNVRPKDMSSKIQMADKVLSRYYSHYSATYFDAHGNGKFRLWAEENGFDSDGIDAEFAADPTDTVLVEFDETFPGDVQTDEMLDILKRCWTDKNAYIFHPNEILLVTMEDWNVSPKDINATINLYKTQCPNLFNEGMRKDKNIITLLTIGDKLKVPYMQFLADMYSIDRLKRELPLSPSEWAFQNKHCLQLMEMAKKRGDICPLKTIASAISSFYHRIAPQLMLNCHTKIVDSINEVAQHIVDSVVAV
eukprot:483604_1